uniref:Translation initiation factor IF2/IF5 domain-containing protein n=1 Tax=viral metagenome TaxID=1070528 RepID=A0A6C0ATC9_9ZZZZ
MSEQWVNVDGSDAEGYRYTMPRVCAKHEGRGNGVKTRVTNLCDVATALGRTPRVLLRYLSIELGAQCALDAAAGGGTLNGTHTADALQTLVHAFARHFVLCARCALPETVLVVTKKGRVRCRCTACGHRGAVAEGHKLLAHIVKDAARARSAAAGASRRSAAASGGASN